MTYSDYGFTDDEELRVILDNADKAYYSGKPIMADLAYDALREECEKRGILVTTVGVDIKGSKLAKKYHLHKVYSLNKTKDIDVLSEFVGAEDCVLSWKLDGLTLILSYNQGVLLRAVTRGNGEIGEVVTRNTFGFKQLPQHIPYRGAVIVRGECLISRSNFELINEKLTDEEPYKNPRNLAAGSIRQLESSVANARHLEFVAFDIDVIDGSDLQDYSQRLLFLKELGFDVVPWRLVTKDTLVQEVQQFEKDVTSYTFATDGLVVTYNDIAHALSLGTTSKYPKSSLAFKWCDEIIDTKLRGVEWSASRSGRLNPVALFDSVELEGSVVSRASLHNVSVLNDLELGVGDILGVYKANMIIPQIAYNKTRSSTLKVPSCCPVCGVETKIIESETDSATLVLYCTNTNCSAKKIGLFTHFTSRNAMNIDGLSEETLTKLVNMGYIECYSDIYTLKDNSDDLKLKGGFGTRSVEKLLSSIDTSKVVDFYRVIYAIGIKHVGVNTSKILATHFDTMLHFLSTSVDELLSLSDIGETTARAIYTHIEKNKDDILELVSHLDIIYPNKSSTVSAITGKTFVLTGSLYNFANRNALVADIEGKGGRVASAVSKTTDYLLTNDTGSGSAKNRKAKELGVRIINEMSYMSGDF